MRRKIDIKGDTYGRLTVTKDSNLKTKHGYVLWECLCACGNTSLVTSNNLRKLKTQSCGCLFLEGKTTHGYTGTIEHNTWMAILARVKKGYLKGLPLPISDNFVKSFPNFLYDIGSYPSDGIRYTVDRIDNSLGYVEGNLKWSNYRDQARNKGIVKRNKSGINGVALYYTKRGIKTYKATWRYLCGKKGNKDFSTKKYGEELAFLMACEYREKQILLLNLQGANYNKNHGKASYKPNPTKTLDGIKDSETIKQTEVV